MKKLLFILFVLFGFFANAQNIEVDAAYLREKLVIKDSTVSAITTGDTLATKEWTVANTLLQPADSISFNELKAIDGPVIAHVGGNHWVVVNQVTEDSVSVLCQSAIALRLAVFPQSSSTVHICHPFLVNASSCPEMLSFRQAKASRCVSRLMATCAIFRFSMCSGLLTNSGG